jgi:type II restriction enzyme
MNLAFDFTLGRGYKSASQKARVLTEGWVLRQVYCPSCGGNVTNYTNNKPVADFYCQKCIEDFELKSKKGKFGRRVSAGAYKQMIKRVCSVSKPNFFFMGHLHGQKVNNFFIVPKHFFVPEIIEKRKPLGKTARRAGWVGSNILFSKIPKAGQIYYVEGGREIPKADVLKKWQKTLFLKKITKVEAKGWVLDTMKCIETLGKKEFTLGDIYMFEETLKKLHPGNSHIKDKIRQQLQILRDKKYLKFKGRGIYEIA